MWQVKSGKGNLGPGWPTRYAVNERAQSGLALIHILAALGYDWGLQLLLPLGAQLDLQVAPAACPVLLPVCLLATRVFQPCAGYPLPWLRYATHLCLVRHLVLLLSSMSAAPVTIEQAASSLCMASIIL